jgi:CRP-like cAMP-binding protein
MYTNTVLRALDRETIERLRLRPVKFEVEQEIEFPGRPVSRIYFMESGMATQTCMLEDGTQVGVGMFGYESVIGISALMGTKHALNRVYIQIAGAGYMTPLELARLEFNRGGIFQLLALRYVQAQRAEGMQLAACNAQHSFEQRLARLLLICADRANAQEFALTQEHLGQMLGATRSTVSITASLLRYAALIQYTRGVVKILDTAGLEARACECYRAVRNHLENDAEFDGSITA